jgi:hypothetical protein
MYTDWTQGFWTIVNFLTDGLLLSAFALRVAGLRTDHQGNPKDAAHLQLKSFQVLSCVAPLIWMKLVSRNTWGVHIAYR